MTTETKVELRKGLRDVHFDRTETSYIDGKAGKLLYRGFNIHDLAEKSSFEETSYLLLHGALPTKSELGAFDAELRASRGLPTVVLDVIAATKNAHPMDVMRTATSAMSAADEGDITDLSREPTLRRGTRLTAALPAIVAAHHRLRTGQEPVPPDSRLPHAANFLNMLFGEPPRDDDAKLIDKDFVLHAEHGVNASTFGARVAASTGADYYATITAAISVLKGPKHGGAAEGVMKMAQEIGSVENAKAYVDDLLAGGGRVMGFGHPVYKTTDPRSVHMKAEARALADRMDQPKWFAILQAVTETEALKKRARLGTNPNVDFWAGAVYSLLGIPDDLFIPLFAIGRMPGWTAHVLEQYSKRDLLRPRLLYSGEHDREYVPVDDR